MTVLSIQIRKTEAQKWQEQVQGVTQDEKVPLSTFSCEIIKEEVKNVLLTSMSSGVMQPRVLI